MNLYKSLIEYSESEYYPMHMPGHKRNTELFNMVNPYAIDITEVENFDNLHHAEGILQEGMNRANELYGAAHTNYLVGGSTCGNLTGISACTNKGDKILVARNCHKSVYNAIFLNELNPVYIYPQIIREFGINGGISPKEVEEMLIREQGIKLVVITSPTYEGVISDVEGIAKITHKYGIPLMVDEAHGSHLGFSQGYPKGAVQKGADIVIHSIHKTLPAFTQSALIHVNGNLVDYENIKRYLSIYQSSSPSYVLMAGMEQCITLLREKGNELFGTYYQRLKYFYEKLNACKNIRILTDTVVKKNGFFDFDSSKIVLSVKGTNMTGKELYLSLLQQYKIQMELVSHDYVLGLTSIGDREVGFLRLAEAVLKIDKEINKTVEDNTAGKSDIGFTLKPQIPETLMPSHIAQKQNTKRLLLTECKDKIAAEYIYLYPPGIPLLVPGERLTDCLLDQILEYKKKGLSVQGFQDVTGNYLKVVD